MPARKRKPAELVIRYRNGTVYKVHGYPPPRRVDREEFWRRLRTEDQSGEGNI